MSRRVPLLLALALTGVLVVACGASSPEDLTAASPTERTATPASPPAVSPTPSPAEKPPPAPGTVPPPWLGTRALPQTPEGFGEQRPTPRELRTRRFTLPDRLPALPGEGFASQVVTPPPARVLARSTWQPGCPVASQELAWVRIAFWGFDGRRHTGELLANARVADDLVSVFRRLYVARFPMEELRITRQDEQDAAPTGDGNNTGAFNCRPTRGGASYSQHAYGLAVDVNPFQNPYVKGDLVLPELAGAYTDRSRRAPGTIHADDVVVRAFASIGWEWGGAWRTLKDYQHFSENGL